MNCVGFRNHKYFFLLVVYTVLNCTYVSCTMAETVWGSLGLDMPLGNRFLLVLGFVLSTIMDAFMSLFLAFHSWLMVHGLSTIEYCEKRSAKPGGAVRASPHDLGLYGNLCAALGPRPCLWLLPVRPPLGDGLAWPEPDDSEEDPEWTARQSASLET